MEALTAEPDHVAVVVADIDTANARWRTQLGGRRVRWFHREGVFRGQQLRYPGGAKLELLMPSESSPEDGFLRRFLEQHGPGVHHVTLKVPDLEEATAVVGEGGLDVVDIDASHDHWHEGFLRPSQVGGLVVQLAWTDISDADWAAYHDHEPRENPPDAADLQGPLLRHPDLSTAHRIWTLLGADITADAGGLTCRWGSSPLSVRVVPAEPPGPMGLRFAGAPALPPSDDEGAVVIPA